MAVPSPASSLRRDLEPALAADLVQQSPDEVIHLYVDPHYGSDDLALGISAPAWNPDGSNTVPLCPGNQLRPNDVIQTGTGEALRHVPYPFKTIGAALRYIGSTPSRAGLPAGTPPLPYPPNPQSGQKVWTHAIIHLLPGLYAPTTAFEPDFLAEGNGESFPLILPPRVSIQGSSGLNTIIMATGTTAFMFGVWFDPVTGLRIGPSSTSKVAATGEGSFIAAVTIYASGKRIVGASAPQPPMTEQAAVLIDNEVVATPTIANCFFVKNYVGVLVNAYSGELLGLPPQRPLVEHHGLAIIGNTFVWNLVGVWNGVHAERTEADVTPFVLSDWVGYATSRLALVNNIFDQSPPGFWANTPAFCSEFGLAQYSPSTPVEWRHPGTWPFPYAGSAFEGIAQADMIVTGFGDSNAYEEGTELNPTTGAATPRRPYNIAHVTKGWPHTLLRLPPCKLGPTFVTMPSPTGSRNIAAITGHWSNTNPNAVNGPGPNPRGVLFVRDLFCLARFSAGAGFWAGESTFANDMVPGVRGFDGSPLDFRLAPSIAIYDQNRNPSSPTVPNPLVDNGFDLPASGTFQLANGLSIGRPGAFGHANWGFDAWRTDVEGFGNDRVHNHPFVGYTGPTSTDIGADELGDLVVAGYRMGTTTFVKLDVNHPKNPYQLPGGTYPLENHRVYILGPANTQSTALHPAHAAAGFPAPMFRTYSFPNFNQDWPTGYTAQNDPGLTWHSVETTPPQGIVFSRPWRFSSGSASNPPVGLEFLYLGTAADVTPHLLPDPHPWWTQSPGSTLPNGVPPSLTLWQDCLGTGNYNGFLYVSPLSPVTNPPGTSQFGYGGVNFQFRWLDGIENLWSSGPATFARFHRWRFPSVVSGPEFPLAQFDRWCRANGMAGQTSVGAVEPELPSTSTVFSGQLADPIAVRFSLEHNQQGFFSTQQNLQSFLVLVDE